MNASSASTTGYDRPRYAGIKWFWIIAAVLFAIRMVYGLVLFPESVALPLRILSAILFVAGPIFALVAGAGFAWTPGKSGLFLAAGAVIHIVTAVAINNQWVPAGGFPMVLVQSLGQLGLLMWCMGLGALVATLIKEKNLMLPVAIFLAGFDMFLVFNPQAITAQIVTSRPEIFEGMASQVPGPVTEVAATGMKIEPMAFVGPADFFIAAVFFVCLYRFNMRVGTTAKWMAPALVAYLILALTMFPMLPALVPIGLVVMIVNAREFKLNAEERNATIGVGVIALALAGYGLYRRVTQTPPEPPVEPGSIETVQGPAELEATPPTAP